MLSVDSIGQCLLRPRSTSSSCQQQRQRTVLPVKAEGWISSSWVFPRVKGWIFMCIELDSPYQISQSRVSSHRSHMRLLLFFAGKTRRCTGRTWLLKKGASRYVRRGLQILVSCVYGTLTPVAQIGRNRTKRGRGLAGHRGRLSKVDHPWCALRPSRSIPD